MPENSFKSTMARFGAFIKRLFKRVWEYLKVAKMEWIVMVSLFALDLITKSVVEATVAFNSPVVIIPGFLQIAKTHNTGSAYGASFLNDWLGPIGARIFYCVFAVAASVAFILILIRNKGKNKVFRIAIALFVAGAMGNCIDRMVLGYVRDFVHFSFQPYIFNLADAEIVFGVALFIIYFIFLYKDNDKRGQNVTVPIVDELDENDPIRIRDDASDNAKQTKPEEHTEEQTVVGETETPSEQADIKADEAQTDREAESEESQSP